MRQKHLDPCCWAAVQVIRSSPFVPAVSSKSNHPVSYSLIGFTVLPEGCAHLDEDGDHSDAMRALCCLSVVGVQILVIVDQLDLNKKHSHKLQ